MSNDAYLQGHLSYHTYFGELPHDSWHTCIHQNQAHTDQLWPCLCSWPDCASSSVLHLLPSAFWLDSTGLTKDYFSAYRAGPCAFVGHSSFQDLQPKHLSLHLRLLLTAVALALADAHSWCFHSPLHEECRFYLCIFSCCGHRDNCDHCVSC